MLFDFFKLILIAAALAGVMFLLLKKFPQRHKLIFLIWGFVPLLFLLIRLFQRLGQTDHIGYILQGLPFTLCGVTSLLMPFVVLTKNKTVTNFLYFISFPATLFAIALDNTISDSMLTTEYWCFVVPHVIYFIHIGLMLYFKYLKPEIKRLPFVLVSFCVLITLMHLLNLLTARMFPFEGEFTTNFIYTMYPGDRDGPPDYIIEQYQLLKQAWGLVSIPYLYLYLMIPVLAVVCAVLSLPLIKKTTYKRFFGFFVRKKQVEIVGGNTETQDVMQQASQAAEQAAIHCDSESAG